MKRLLIACAALATAAPLAAQELPATPPPVGEPKPFKLPASETYRLANGMQVTLVPYGIAPKTVVSLRVFAGNLNDGGKTWLPDLAGEMLDEGAGGKTATQLATAAADMGGDLNVAVSTQQTAVTMNVPTMFSPFEVAQKLPTCLVFLHVPKGSESYCDATKRRSAGPDVLYVSARGFSVWVPEPKSADEGSRVSRTYVLPFEQALGAERTPHRCDERCTDGGHHTAWGTTAAGGAR